MTSPSDEELLEAWGAGDDSAAAQLINQYFEDLCRFFAGKVGYEAEELSRDHMSAQEYACPATAGQAAQAASVELGAAT